MIHFLIYERTVSKGKHDLKLLFEFTFMQDFFLDWAAVSLHDVSPSWLDFQLGQLLWTPKTELAKLTQEQNRDTKLEWLGPADKPRLKLANASTYLLCKARLTSIALTNDGVGPWENFT